jgi:hypothetical protein
MRGGKRGSLWNFYKITKNGHEYNFLDVIGDGVRSPVGAVRDDDKGVGDLVSIVPAIGKESYACSCWACCQDCIGIVGDAVGMP